METIAYLISAAALVIGTACWIDPYCARFAAGILRSHAAAVEASRKRRREVWGRCSRVATARKLAAE